MLCLSLAFLPAILAGCVSRKVADAPGKKRELPELVFRDSTLESGVRAVYSNGEESDNYSILESLGGGVGLIDFDRDGKMDLVFPGGGKLESGKPPVGEPTFLWRQLDGFRFQEVASASKIQQPSCYTHGVTIGDADNDGFSDILLTGYASVQYWHNQGDGTFVDRTLESGLLDKQWSTSAAWGDLDGDGNLDLYVAHYANWSWSNHPKCNTSESGAPDVCTPNEFQPLNDVVYLSNGNGSFREAKKENGLVPGGKGLGVAISDLDGDGHPDIYVANDTTNNFLYMNKGDAQFEEEGLSRGNALDGNGTPNGSMGIAVFDFDRDLTLDIWVTNYENETCALYLNSGNNFYLWGSEKAGVNLLGKSFVGFGTVASDFDLDGDEDIAIANGHVMRHPRQSTVAQPAVLLRNEIVDKGRRLQISKFTIESYLGKPHRGRGVLSADLDGDGDLDLVFTNVNENAALLLNESERLGTLFSIELIGTSSNRDAYGALATLITDKQRYLRSVTSGGSYLSQGTNLLYWGIPLGEVVQAVEIQWPATKSVERVQAKNGDRILQRLSTP